MRPSSSTMQVAFWVVSKMARYKFSDSCKAWVVFFRTRMPARALAMELRKWFSPEVRTWPERRRITTRPSICSPK